MSIRYTRRGVLLGSASLALAACAGGGRSLLPAVRRDPSAVSYRNEIAGYGPLLSDPAGILDLPEGFSYRTISRFGEAMDDGFLVPNALDGMGSIDLGGGRVALIRNHELSPGNEGRGPTGGRPELVDRLRRLPHFDARNGLPNPGGTSTIVYDWRNGKRVSEHLSLAGTIRNCSGGVTPWGSWLTCEETVELGREAHGWVFEVPAGAPNLVAPVPLKAMGRFNHEAAVVDPVSGVAYLTEDRKDSLFYRFLPTRPGRLASGGRLQALAFAGASADTRNWHGNEFAEGSWREVRWIDLDGTDSAEDDLRLRGHALGGALFARGEGIHLGTGELYFTCTTGGRAKLGQIMRYVPSPDEGYARERDRPARLQLFSESNDDALFKHVDNLAVSPWNHLFVCEDKGALYPVNHLKGITPDGQVYVIARNAHGRRAELAGICFSPDGRTAFVNLYDPGMTLAITGPWGRFDPTAVA